MVIRLQRAYADPAPRGGKRILVERLWPRGLTKERAGIDAWIKEIAPSPTLRKWYGHDPDRWEEFQTRYRSELQANPESVERLRAEIGSGPVTFVFGSKEEEKNSASVLKEYLDTLTTL